MNDFNYAIFLIAAVGAVVIAGIILARSALHIGESDEAPKTPEEQAKEEIESLLTVEEQPVGKKIEDEVGND